MKLVSLVVASMLYLTSVETSAFADKPTRPIIRHFMVTECVKKVCLMKMKPHAQMRGADGKHYWVKIQ